MKRLLSILAFALLVGCSEKPNSEKISVQQKPSNILENLTYSVDTLMVDTGNEIINFGFGLNSSPSPDNQYFYLLDNNLKIQKIDLDHLNLVNFFSLEKDGPNSPGHFFGFYALSNCSFFFHNFIDLLFFRKKA